MHASNAKLAAILVASILFVFVVLIMAGKTPVSVLNYHRNKQYLSALPGSSGQAGGSGGGGAIPPAASEMHAKKMASLKNGVVSNR
ncbi:hypothetical protein BOX15_Mlig014236g4 [Macrostomum lignano]|uniref:Uncharacterized protein n=2 Tax=Macrostomum lignano TaxID=282301 RepID=A0A267F0A1_9PLAT|nr:hypothetical protein BOX15_Mlig020913g1 [Macrostomum lignano]PAA72853.1 hypothetical protein BOX15_Mlig014236g4 [Macrostomum lignano]